MGLESVVGKREKSRARKLLRLAAVAVPLLGPLDDAHADSQKTASNGWEVQKVRLTPEQPEQLKPSERTNRWIIDQGPREFWNALQIGPYDHRDFDD